MGFPSNPQDGQLISRKGRAFIWTEKDLSWTGLPFSVELVEDLIDVDNKANSGYIDIGAMRMAWGTTPSTIETNEAVVFSAPFKAAPIITATINTNAAANVGVGGTTSSITTTGFDFNRNDSIDNTDDPFIHYHAIGLKP